MYQIRWFVALHVTAVLVMFAVVTFELSQVDITRIRALVALDVPLAKPEPVAESGLAGPPDMVPREARSMQSIRSRVSDVVTLNNVDALRTVYPHPLTERTRYMVNSCNARVARCL